MNRAIVVFVIFVLYCIGLCFVSNFTPFILVYSITASVIVLIFSIIGITKKHYYYILKLIVALLHISIIAYGIFRELYG
jgi:hypothetical protein